MPRIGQVWGAAVSSTFAKSRELTRVGLWHLRTGMIDIGDLGQIVSKTR